MEGNAAAVPLLSAQGPSVPGRAATRPAARRGNGQRRLGNLAPALREREWLVVRIANPAPVAAKIRRV
jgi:hypothetical protein